MSVRAWAVLIVKAPAIWLEVTPPGWSARNASNSTWCGFRFATTVASPRVRAPTGPRSVSCGSWQSTSNHAARSSSSSGSESSTLHRVARGVIGARASMSSKVVSSGIQHNTAAESVPQLMFVSGDGSRALGSRQP